MKVKEKKGGGRYYSLGVSPETHDRLLRWKERKRRDEGFRSLSWDGFFAMMLKEREEK